MRVTVFRARDDDGAMRRAAQTLEWVGAPTDGYRVVRIDDWDPEDEPTEPDGRPRPPADGARG